MMSGYHDFRKHPYIPGISPSPPIRPGTRNSDGFLTVLPQVPARVAMFFFLEIETIMCKWLF